MQIKAEIGEKNQFSFNAVLRAIEEDGVKYLEGVASSTNKDQHETIFSAECQDGFASDINNGKVIIDIGHSNKFTDFIGRAYSAQVIKEEDVTKLVVRIKLNQDSNNAQEVYRIILNPNTEMGEPESLGMSIMGTVVRWHKDENGIIIFDRVVLERIAITDKPSNTDTFINVIQRSIENKEESLVSEEKVEEVKDQVEQEVQREAEQPQVEEVKEVVEQVEIKRELQYTEDWKVTAMSIRETIAEYVTKMVNAITSVQASDLTAEMLLVAVKEFIDYYEDKLEYMLWDVEWYGIDETQVAREKSLVKQLMSKNNLSERLNYIIVEREKMSQEKVESVETQAEPQANSSEEVTVMREMLDLVKSLKDEVKSLKDSNESVSRELAEIKNKPTSAPTLPNEVVQREVKQEVSKEDLMLKFFNKK